MGRHPVERTRATRALLLLLATAFAAEQVFEDSPALTALWQATSDGSTDAFISQIIQNKEVGQHRAADGRGPMFWAYEFKNVDALALLTHLGASADQEDVDGKSPKQFFPDSAEAMEEFEQDAKAKVEELAALLSEREEEFYSYQQNTATDENDDYDDEDDDAGDEDEPAAKPKKKLDTIDYADDEDEEDDPKDEM